MTNRQIIIPKDEKHWLELRAEDLTSTDVGVLFDLSRYSTLFETWYRKKDRIILTQPENEWTKWGKRLQESIAHGFAEDNGWKIRPMTEYIRLADEKLGSSFDYAIGEDGILEIKNVFGMKFRDEWIVDGKNIEAPPDIELQVQHQLGVSGRQYAYIGALVGGNQAVLLKREPDPKIFKAIQDKAAPFWESIRTGKAPNPDFTRDADFISRLYSQADSGKVLDARDNGDIAVLANEHRFWSQEEKKACQQKEAIKAQLLMKIGPAEKVLGPGFSISASVVAPAHVEYDREAYRQFRINFKKVKDAQ